MNWTSIVTRHVTEWPPQKLFLLARRCSIEARFGCNSITNKAWKKKKKNRSMSSDAILTYSHEAKLLLYPCRFMVKAISMTGYCQHFVCSLTSMPGCHHAWITGYRNSLFILWAACSSHWVLCAGNSYCLLLATHLPDRLPWRVMGPASHKLETRGPVVLVKMKAQPKGMRFHRLTHPLLLSQIHPS